MALIYDLGMHRCEDTAYYLWQGHDVVAVEANKGLVENAHALFKDYIESNRLRIINRAISDQKGTRRFWVDQSKTEWGSLNRNIPARKDSVLDEHMVETISLSDLIRLHGVPHYLKIDIESEDLNCVTSLPVEFLPHFISVESECLEANSDSVTTATVLATLDALYHKGYRRFKLVDQYTLTIVSWDNLNPRQTYGGGGKGPRAKLNDALGWHFAHGSTGPWGELLSGEWLPYDLATNLCLAARQEFFNDESVQPFDFWCDWHACT